MQVDMDDRRGGAVRTVMASELMAVVWIVSTWLRTARVVHSFLHSFLQDGRRVPKRWRPY